MSKSSQLLPIHHITADGFPKHTVAFYSHQGILIFHLSKYGRKKQITFLRCRWTLRLLYLVKCMLISNCAAAESVDYYEKSEPFGGNS